jgi:hypothetical protein
MSLRYNEINVNAQCRSCNRFDEGNIPAYTLALVKKYGDDIISKLLVAKHKNVKFSQFDVDYWVNHYKKMVEIRKKHLKL